ncbi:VOC family protein [Ancylobacter crimeensis]|nr:VOC family protein [Ancylobacter crimeensis]
MSLGCRDLARSAGFYDAVLAPLGLVRVAAFPEPGGPSACWGPPGEIPAPEGVAGAAPFWLEQRAGEDIACPPGFHLAFLAPDVAVVHAFHAAGLAVGGHDNGPPGPRPHYGAGYYAAFLIDPDGWRIEAVTYTGASDPA